MLKLSGISKRYGETSVLDGVSLDVGAGETVAIIGPSGCGKSTLLRIVNGLVQPDSGQVFVGGERVSPDNIRELRRRIGYVVQGGGLFPHLTARENVTLAARVFGIRTAQIEQRVVELAELVSLSAAQLDRYPLNLSGGQNQRVALMRALMLEPQLMLMDEPLAALDPMVRAELQEELRLLFTRLGKAVIFVTHDLAEAGYISDRIVVLGKGHVAQVGTLDELVRNPADGFVRSFVDAYRVPEILGRR